MTSCLTLKISVILIALTLLFLPRLAKAQGNLVYNGGFDISSNGINADGWTFTGGFYNEKNGNPLPDLDLSGTASQTINSLTPGVIYLVSGDYQDLGGGSSADSSFGVAFNGDYLFETIAPTNFNWYSFNFEYMAASTSAVLSLSSGLNGTGISYAIDNISIYAVPEPNSLCLIGVGGIVSTILFGNRKKNLAQKR
jgi:hypothetical protein